MHLLFVIQATCFVMAFTSKISKKLVGWWISVPAALLDARTKHEEIRKELTGISMRDEYIRYVQTERKLVTLEAEVQQLQANHNRSKTYLEYGLDYALYALMGLVLIVLSIFYRYTPVVVFGDNFNFEPFGRVLSFPTGVSNGISTIFWIGVNNFVARSLAGYCK